MGRKKRSKKRRGSRRRRALPKRTERVPSGSAASAAAKPPPRVSGGAWLGVNVAVESVVIGVPPEEREGVFRHAGPGQLVLMGTVWGVGGAEPEPFAAAVQWDHPLVAAVDHNLRVRGSEQARAGLEPYEGDSRLIELGGAAQARVLRLVGTKVGQHSLSSGGSVSLVKVNRQPVTLRFVIDRSEVDSEHEVEISRTGPTITSWEQAARLRAPSEGTE